MDEPVDLMKALEDSLAPARSDQRERVSAPRWVRCPRCGAFTRKATEAEALADCPERDYAAEEAFEEAFEEAAERAIAAVDTAFPPTPLNLVARSINVLARTLPANHEAAGIFGEFDKLGEYVELLESAAATTSEPEWDGGECPYYARFRNLPGHNPEAECQSGCVDEPACVTSEPAGGWPSIVAANAQAADRVAVAALAIHTDEGPYHSSYTAGLFLELEAALDAWRPGWRPQPEGGDQ